MSKSRDKISAALNLKEGGLVVLADKDYAQPTSSFLFSDEVLEEWEDEI